MFLFVLFAVVLFGLLMLSSRRKSRNNIDALCTLNKRLDGKTTIVTGGTSGIGLEIAKDFAKRGARVIVACPFEEEGRNGERIIREETENKNVYFRILDLGSLKSIREFVSDINKTEKRLDILVNNAGCAIPDVITDDGFNSLMQINYFGTVLLTILLLPLLNKTGKPTDPARIVNNASVLHLIGYMKYFTLDIGGHGMVKRYIIYGTSKLCLTLFTTELDKRIGSNVVVANADPGAVGTKIFYDLGYISGFILKNVFYYFAKTARDGAQCAIYVALHDNPNEVRGKYFRNQNAVKPFSQASDEKLSAKVWEDTIRLLKLTNEELQACFGNA